MSVEVMDGFLWRAWSGLNCRGCAPVGGMMDDERNGVWCVGTFCGCAVVRSCRVVRLVTQSSGSGNVAEWSGRSGSVFVSQINILNKQMNLNF